jgi:hypothetical protein
MISKLYKWLQNIISVLVYIISVLVIYRGNIGGFS